MVVRWRTGLVIVACGVAAFSHPRPVHAQAGAGTPQLVPHRVTCPTCTIRLTQIATIGGERDRVVQGGAYTGLERDSKGRFYASASDRFQVVVFAPDGKLLTVFGRRGEGPGEFGISRGIDRIRIGRGDTVFVFHSEGGVEVFTPSFGHVRAIDLPYGNRSGIAVLANGNLFLSSPLRTPNQVGHPYHIFSRDGAPILSFGGDGRPIGPGRPPDFGTEIVLAPDLTSVWGGSNYRLMQWGMDGKKLRDFQVHSIPWFQAPDGPPNARPRPGTPGWRPPGGVHIAGVDSSGFVWINGSTPIGLDAGGTWGGQSARLLEVFDPKTGTILVSETGHPALRFIAGSNLALAVKEDANGALTYTVWRAELRR